MLLTQLIILQVITFAALVFVLRKFLYTETASQVRRLQELNAENEKRAEELRRKVEKAEAEYEQRIRKASQDAARIQEEAHRRIEKMQAESFERAKEESEKILAQARNAREKMREEIKSELEGRAVGLACELVKNVFDEKVFKIIHGALVAEMIKGLGHIDDSKISGTVADAEISTAFILERHEKERIKEILSKKSSREIDAGERQDKDLIAGVVIKLGNLIIDGSLSNRLREAEEKIKKAAV